MAVLTKLTFPDNTLSVEKRKQISTYRGKMFENLRDLPMVLMLRDEADVSK